MMQATKMIMRSSSICESFIPNSVYTQCIRWKRKPLWLGTAKTKLFRIPKRPVQPTEDILELKRLYNVYRTCITSLREHINTIVKEDKVKIDGEVEQIEQVEEDFKSCEAINDEWNAAVTKLREDRLAIERKVVKEKVLQNMIEVEKKREIERRQADEEIRKAKEESGTFITAENIDTAIEECLANVVNPNRALDVNGTWYEGQYPPTPAVDETTTQSTVVQQ